MLNVNTPKIGATKLFSKGHSIESKFIYKTKLILNFKGTDIIAFYIRI